MRTWLIDPRFYIIYLIMFLVCFDNYFSEILIFIFNVGLVNFLFCEQKMIKRMNFEVIHGCL